MTERCRDLEPGTKGPNLLRELYLLQGEPVDPCIQPLTQLVNPAIVLIDAHFQLVQPALEPIEPGGDYLLKRFPHRELEGAAQHPAD